MQQPDHPEVTVRLRTKFGLGSRAANCERQSYKDIRWFGGSELFRSFLDFGRVDTVEVKIISVLLRSGVPLLPPPPYTPDKLRLHSHKSYRAARVALAYEVQQLA
jgi:dihydrofolate reductase